MYPLYKDAIGVPVHAAAYSKQKGMCAPSSHPRGPMGLTPHHKAFAFQKGKTQVPLIQGLCSRAQPMGLELGLSLKLLSAAQSPTGAQRGAGPGAHTSGVGFATQSIPPQFQPRSLVLLGFSTILCPKAPLEEHQQVERRAVLGAGACGDAEWLYHQLHHLLGQQHHRCVQ